MFGFLGGRNRKRQIQDSNRNSKDKENHQYHGSKQNGRLNVVIRQQSSSSALEGDHFLDNSSVDMSLYTTPSRATLQYHRGVHNLHDWQSHDSTVTPEVASVQSRLGGWEPPSPPRPIPEEEEGVSRRSPQSQKRGTASKRSVTSRSSSHSNTSRVTSSSNNYQRGNDSIRETSSMKSSVKCSGPVDVDSLSFAEEDEEHVPADFSDLLSTFEGESLADRMAPNTAPTHHERTRRKIIGKSAEIGQDDTSRRSKNSSGSKSNLESPSKKQSATGRGTFAVASKGPSVCSSLPISPNGTKTSYRSETHSNTEGFALDWDDSRSLGTEVSGLTMLTMEQSVAFQSRSLHTVSPISRPHQPEPSVVSEATSSVFSSVPEDVSFSGLLSKFEEESRAGVLALTTKASPGRDRRDQTLHEHAVMQPEMYLTLGPSSTPGDSESTRLESRSSRSRKSDRNIVSSQPKEEIEKEKQMQEGVITVSESAKEFCLDSVVDPHPLDDVSFSGLLSTIEAESLAGRMDAVTSLGNLELPDSESEMMSSLGSIQGKSCESLGEMQSVATEVSQRQPSILSSRLAETNDDAGGEPFTPSARSEVAAARLKATLKRSNVNSTSSKNEHEEVLLSDANSLPKDNTMSFSNILSVFEARSAASNKLEPPATKRLLLTGGFPIHMEERRCADNTANVIPQHDSYDGVVRSEDAEDGQTEDGGDLITEAYSMEPTLPEHASPFSPLIGDELSTYSHGSWTIDDQSTIPPPPHPDEYSWNEESWNPMRPRPSNLFASVGSTEIDGMTTMSFMEEEQECHSETEDNTSASNLGDRLPCTAASTSDSTSQLQHSLQYSYSASMETSLQYSESTAPCNLVSDISSLLVSAEKHRALPKQQLQDGPVDLDETVADSSSENSSLHGSASLFGKPQETPPKPITNLDVESPLSHDDDDEHQFVDEEDEVGEDEDDDRSFSSSHNDDYYDEATVEHSYKATMESLSSARFEAGCLLLTESELQKHMKSTQFIESLPSSNLKGYDNWKRKQFEKQRYFAQIHEKAMKRKEKRDKILERRHLESQASPQMDSTKKSGASSATASMMERSMSSTIQTSRLSEPLPPHKEKVQVEHKRGWGFLRGPLKRRDENTASISANSPAKNKKNKKKREPAVVTLDHFMKVSQDEPDDISLVPMNKLDPGVVTLTSSIPQGATSTATKSHILDDPGVGPRLLALQHLEIERAKNRKAEKEKTEMEIQEQKRIAMLKERELERQRRLNAPKAEKRGQNVFSSKLNCKTQASSTDEILERNLSFGTTNTAMSSIKSPSCVLSPCILCNAAERSHVAQPCMHFYFCEDCAHELSCSASSPVCPICTTPNVSFSRVYT